MKIVNILGGLGNQMFAYAMLLSLKEEHPSEKVYCCTRAFKGYGLHNGFELNRIFGIERNECSMRDLVSLAYPFLNYKTWQVMCHWLPSRKTMTKGTTQIEFDYNEVTREDSVFYDGYWQNENFFKKHRELILQTYSFPMPHDNLNKEVLSKLECSRAASLHVRRGDYLKDPSWCVCSPLYYERAICKMNDMVNPELYLVFSDDIEWTKDNLGGLFGKRDVVFVNWNKGPNSFIDMQLMANCHYNIIANSSFSWWGAWLNDHADKAVVTPSRWANYETINSPICENWIKIDVE